jgi:hypothetical protein
MDMPKNWLEWLGVIGTILTIVSFILYLAERRTRKLHDTLMLGFLHGIKPLVESISKRSTISGNELSPLLAQVNDMLARLQPPK